jgi:hypothetical protein
MSDASCEGLNLFPYLPSEGEIHAVEEFATYVISDAEKELQGKFLLSVERRTEVGGMVCAGRQLRPSSILLQPNCLTTVWLDFIER